MINRGLFARRDVSDVTAESIRPLMQWTYVWMIVGLLVTAAVATSSATLTLVFDHPELIIVAIIAEFALVIGLSLMISRLSPAVAAVLFLVYSALNGFTLSLLIYSYTGESVGLAFLITAATFGAMTVIGFTTKIDLTNYRTYFLVGLIGLVIAMVVNIFLQSSVLEIIISFAGVALFMALTAYDTQKIKFLAASPQFQSDGSAIAKYSIICALMLYLDFVNLFIFLLRLFGRRR